MTLDKHKLYGISKISSKTLPASNFEKIMIDAGYTITGTAPAQGNRIKKWWNHSTFSRIEVIYSPDEKTVITAYHVS